MSKTHEFAMYRGEDCLGTGTAKELAEQMNFKIFAEYWGESSDETLGGKFRFVALQDFDKHIKQLKEGM